MAMTIQSFSQYRRLRSDHRAKAARCAPWHAHSTDCGLQQRRKVLDNIVIVCRTIHSQEVTSGKTRPLWSIQLFADAADLQNLWVLVELTESHIREDRKPHANYKWS